MERSKHPSECQSAKGEEDAVDKPVAPGSMLRFAALTKQLLNVPRDQLVAAEAKYEMAKQKKPNKTGPKRR